MRYATLFVMTAIAGIMATTSQTFAQSAPLEIHAPGQPFFHPASDKSYAKDMQDDEFLAKAKASDSGKAFYISGDRHHAPYMLYVPAKK